MTDNFQTRLSTLQGSSFVGVSNEWIELENDVMDANTKLIENIFGDSANNSGTGSMLDTLSYKINKMFSIQNDSLTNIEMNENNKYKYNYNLVYLILKICIFIVYLCRSKIIER